MKEIVNILMKRDGLSKSEAISIVQHTKLMIDEAIESGDYDAVEEILADELGLELDYIYNFI